ncbi:hypothetical protein MCAP1_002042 [Malassezia caprae]|uniref:Wax synthase domain-containing protein n=1 Tax=Malassezia caprae TaxID=1381934 RepID=A0AAF0E8L3_9BASI|nr:hypothetical protein MCAP1_002042 [Malassezia caprae]
MSHAAALLVPLGAPLAPPCVPPLIGARSFAQEEETKETREESAWSDAGADPEPVWSGAWFHGGAPSDAPISAGEVRAAMGSDEGTVYIFARAITRSDDSAAADAAPSTPRADEPRTRTSPPTEDTRPGVITRRHHRRNLQLLVASLSSSDASSLHSAPPSCAATSPQMGCRDPTVSTSHTTASSTSDDPGRSAAENLLEAQYHASAVPTVIEHPFHEHPKYVPHVHEHHAPAEAPEAHMETSAEPRQGPAPIPPNTPCTDAAPEPLAREPAPWTTDDSPWTCLRCLYSPDATAVVAITVTGPPSAPGLLLVQQASGRLTAWDRATLSMLGTVSIHTDISTNVVFEYQAASPDKPVYKSVARCAHAMDAPHDLGLFDVAPVRLAGGCELLAPCVVVQWPGAAPYAYLLYLDTPRAALLPAAVLHLPGAPSKMLWELQSSRLVLYSLDEAAWHMSHYDVHGQDLDAPCVASSEAALATLQQQLRAPDDVAAPFLDVRVASALDAASTARIAAVDAPVHQVLLLDDMLVCACHGSAPELVGLARTHEHVVRMALPSAAEQLVQLGTRLGVACTNHALTVQAALRGDVPHLEIVDEVLCEARQLAVPVPDLLVRVMRTAPENPAPPQRWSAILPLSLNRLVLGLPTGGLAVASLSDVLSDAPTAQTPAAHSHPSWAAPVSSLQLVANPRTGTRHLIGGTAQGDLGVWDLATLRSEAAWSWFASPLQALVPLTGVQPHSRLYGCVLCVALDGTSALLALDDVRLVQLFPGAGAPLTSVAVREHHVLLTYGARTRLWDLHTLEMVRSMTAAEARTLLHEPSWLVYAIPTSPRSAPPRSDAITGMLSPCGGAQKEAVSVLVADVRRAIEAGAQTLRAALQVPSLVPLLEVRTRHLLDADAPEAPALPAESAGAAKLQSTLQPLLPLFWPTALDAVFGTAASWGANPGSARVLGYVSMACEASAAQRFCQSPEATAHQLLAGVSLALLWDTIHADARGVLHALLSPAFLAQLVGRAYCAPSLPTLGMHVLDENEVLRTAAKLLLARYVPVATEDELTELERQWRGHVPLAPSDPATPRTPLAVLVLGLVMSERYAHFSPSLLKRVAAMVAAYLAQPAADSLPAWVATELCCTGYHVWQHYVDTVALVRHIFCVAAEPDDVAATHQRLTGLTLRGLARRATLELASKHSALFMSTLAMDILHAPSVEQSQVTLRLVAFLIRQKPLVLYPSLPRLVEAVVKSLDPTLVAVRSSLTRSAAVMIKELVETYPSIAFHSGTQRLAVGTHDGPVVLYDLKTATRLYVLDGHTAPVTACSFSPDGRRFLSLCLGEGLVLLWRLSGGFVDMLRPRHAKGEASAYRSIPLHLGDAAQLPLDDTLGGVSLEWRDAHGVHLRIGEAHVNLNLSMDLVKAVWADIEWSFTGLLLPRYLNPAYVLVPHLPRFLELFPQLQMRENVWQHLLGPLGFEVQAYPVTPYPLEIFFDELLRFVLDLSIFQFVLFWPTFDDLRRGGSRNMRRFLVVVHITQLFLWALAGTSGQSRLINFLRAALAFRSSLLLWDVVMIRPVDEVRSWSRARLFAQLWLFPVEEDELEQRPGSRRPRLQCLYGVGLGIVYLLLAQFALLVFPPMEVVREMPKYQYMCYGYIMVLALYVMLSSTGLLVMNVAGLVLGIEQAPMFENPFFTTSIQQFWTRWNRAIATVLHRVVFGPSTANSKKKHSNPQSKPPPSLKRFAQTSLMAMFTFLVSGLFHEFLLYCSTPGLYGWQTLFFLLNGLMAVASNALTRYAPGVVRRTPIFVRFLVLVLFCCRFAHLFFVPLQTDNMLAEPQMVFQLLVLPRNTPPQHAYFLRLFSK